MQDLIHSKTATSKRQKFHIAIISVLLLAASACFTGSLTLPFISNTFNVQLTRRHYIDLWKSISSAGGRKNSMRGWLERQAFNMGDQMVKRRLTKPTVRRLNTQLKKYAMNVGGIREGKYYLPQIIRELYKAKEYLVAITVTCFSLVFPAAKILLCILALLPVFPDRRRGQLASLVKAVSKWSMGDVFVVALIVVFFKATGFSYQFHSEIGVHLYFWSFVCSSVAAILLSRMSFDK